MGADGGAGGRGRLRAIYISYNRNNNNNNVQPRDAVPVRRVLSHPDFNANFADPEAADHETAEEAFEMERLPRRIRRISGDTPACISRGGAFQREAA